MRKLGLESLNKLFHIEFKPSSDSRAPNFSSPPAQKQDYK